MKMEYTFLMNNILLNSKHFIELHWLLFFKLEGTFIHLIRRATK